MDRDATLAYYDQGRQFLRRHLFAHQLDGNGVTVLLRILQHITEEMCCIANPEYRRSKEVICQQ